MGMEAGLQAPQNQGVTSMKGYDLLQAGSMPANRVRNECSQFLLIIKQARRKLKLNIKLLQDAGVQRQYTDMDSDAQMHSQAWLSVVHLYKGLVVCVCV